MKTTVWLLLIALTLTGTALAIRADDAKSKKADTRVFELRTYYAAPGKMDALNARFRDHTCALFKKHGMTIVAFWNPTDAEQAQKKLIYVLAFPSREAADASWKAFREDPEWIAARKASEQNGKLVDRLESVYMSATDYSPMK